MPKKFGLLAFASALTFSLGSWQLYRWHYKRCLLSDLKQALYSDTPPESIKSLDQLEAIGWTKKYKLMLLSSLNDQKESTNAIHAPRYFLVGPRACSVGSKKSISQGFLVIKRVDIALPAEEKSVSVLVNCGILPKKNLEAFLATPLDQADGRSINSIEVIRDKTEHHRPFINGVWHLFPLDEQTMQVPTKDYNLLHSSLVSTMTTKDDGVTLLSKSTNMSLSALRLIDGHQNTLLVMPDPIAQIPNRHAEYVITWWSTSFLSGLIWWSCLSRRAMGRKRL